MDKSRILTLIARSYADDDLLQKIPHDIRRDVFCDIQSVTQTEFFKAGEIGLRAEYKATMFGPDYASEKLCELDGTVYTIYRTYAKKTDEIELYMGIKVGESNG